MNNETITVYWSPITFLLEEESWNMLYQKPISISSELRKLKNENAKSETMFLCPASNDLLNNVFAVYPTMNDKVVFSDNLLESVCNSESSFENPTFIPTESKINVRCVRKTSLDGYVNLIYNMGWIFFADEPLIARFTAPYSPPSSPAEGVILSSGEFDIGQWFRPFNLDYHIPLKTKELSFKEENPFFYLEFFTNKKIIFKKFTNSKKLFSLQEEFTKSPSRYKKHIPLASRYLMSNKSSMSLEVLSEIKRNLVE
jgi:hypothetical protein